MVFERDAGRTDRDGGGFDTGRGAESIENPVGLMAQSFQVAGLAIIHGDLKRENMAGVEAWAYASEFLKAAEKQAGSREQRNGERDLHAYKHPLERIPPLPETWWESIGLGEMNRKDFGRAPRIAGTRPQRRVTSATDQAEQNRGTDSSVEMNFFDARNVDGDEERKTPEAPRGENEAQHGSDER